MDTDLKLQKQLEITRRFNAPRSVVWRAWTDAEQLKAWMSPKDFTTPFYKLDLRVGGSFLNCMRDPEGKDTWSTGRYLEIVVNEKLVMTDSFADENGRVVNADYYGMGTDFPLEGRVTITFTDDGNQTQMNLLSEAPSAIPPDHLEGMTQGWNECFDKLEKLLQ